MSAIERDEISIKELILLVRNWFFFIFSKWKLILVVGILGAAIGFFYASSIKPMYKAEYTFVLEDEKSGGFSGALGIASQFGLDVGGSDGGVFSGDNLMELMRSRVIVQKAMMRPVFVNGSNQSLMDYYLEFNGFGDSWINNSELSNLHYPINAGVYKFNRIQDSIFTNVHQNIITNSLSVDKLDKKLSIIKVEVRSTDELFAKTFSENLVDEVSRFYIETKTKKSVENVSVLQFQTDSVRNELNRAISGVAKSEDGIPNLNVAKQVLRAPSQQRQIDVEANTAILTELVKNLEISKLNLRKEIPLIQAIDKPVLPLQKERVSKLKGMIIGGGLACFIITLFLLIREFFRNSLS